MVLAEQTRHGPLNAVHLCPDGLNLAFRARVLLGLGRADLASLLVVLLLTEPPFKVLLVLHPHSRVLVVAVLRSLVVAVSAAVPLASRVEPRARRVRDAFVEGRRARSRELQARLRRQLWVERACGQRCEHHFVVVHRVVVVVVLRGRGWRRGRLELLAQVGRRAGDACPGRDVDGSAC